MSRGQKPGRPSLLDSEARGGDTAEKGFAFQENLLVARIPRWLRRESFSEMIREALGDAEARFFVPGAPQRIECIEFKDHQVHPAEFWKEIRRFQDLDAGAPSAYERFVLVCRGVSQGVQPVLNGLRRVRDAFPFYTGFEEVQGASYDGFVAAVENAGHARDDAWFLFSKVFLESDAPNAEGLSLEVFSGALKEHFPEWMRLSGDDVVAAFERLRSLVKSRKNQPIARAALEDALWSEVPNALRADRRPVRVITATEPVDRWSATDIVFEWEEFFGKGDRNYPAPEAWTRMRLELESARDWMVAAGRPRSISLGGSRRLSGSLCIGAVFSAVSGFTLEMDYRGDVWRTDEYGGPEYRWNVERAGKGPAQEIAIVIGILRDVQTDVARFLTTRSNSCDLRVVLNGAEALAGAATANSAVAAAKKVISAARSASGAAVVHLFLAVPAPFALFLGHRLNAVGEIRCYEWDGKGSYVQSCHFST